LKLLNSIESESNKFLECINFSNFAEDSGQSKVISSGNDKKVRFNDPSLILPGQTSLLSHKEENKDEHDLFAEDPQEKQHAPDYDPFADDESPKNANEHSDDDLFGGDDHKSKAKHHNESDDKDDDFFGSDEAHAKEDDDDPFAEPTEKSETQKPKLKSQMSVIQAGDLFMKEYKHIIIQDTNNKTDKTKKFVYFGELKDAESLYASKLNSLVKTKSLKEIQRNTPFEVVSTGMDTIKMIEKAKLNEIKNKSLIESKIFEKLSQYKYRNKDLDTEFKLELLTSDCKLPSKLMILETEKKRNDLKFEIEENMNKLYDSDIKEIMSYLDAKRRKQYEDKHGHEMPEEQEAPDAIMEPQVAQENEQDKTLPSTDDLDEISSIDSDTREEEKKFSHLSGVFGSMIFQSLIHN